jgi:hypothetical protein
VTCNEVATKLNDPTVNNTLARAVIADFQAKLSASVWPNAASSVVAVRQPCLTSNVSATCSAGCTLGKLLRLCHFHEKH